jgi:mono/diheme cytochrome c family protein
MRHQSLFMILCGLFLLHAACSDSSSSNSDASRGAGGAAATGGSKASGGTIGTGAGGTAGSTTVPGAGGAATGGTTGTVKDAAADAPDANLADAPVIDASIADLAIAEAASGEVGLTGPAARGQYLVKNVLGCVGCHTPQLAGGGGLDNSRFLAGVECFAKDSAGGCLSSANLTSDKTGLKDMTDTQIKNAFTKGIDPEAGADGGVQYLFAQMPYYQFANLTDDDATAIVAYLRTVPAVAHEAAVNTGTFATQPSAPQWAPVNPAELPNAAAIDGGTAGNSNGKYLATLACATCHTPNTAATAPLQLDATKAFQGGKKYTTTLAGDGGTQTKEIQSTNLTPDSTGLKNWTAPQIVTAIKAGKDEAGRTICSPMRSLPGITNQDATDIANYLLAIPPVANPNITETCE